MSYRIHDTFIVSINNDYELVDAFLQWMIDNQVADYALGSVGRGSMVKVLPIEYQDAVDEFFRSGNQD